MTNLVEEVFRKTNSYRLVEVLLEVLREFYHENQELMALLSDLKGLQFQQKGSIC